MLKQLKHKRDCRTEFKNKLKYSDKTSKNYRKYYPTLENKIALIHYHLLLKLKKNVILDIYLTSNLTDVDVACLTLPPWRAVVFEKKSYFVQTFSVLKSTVSHDH